MTSVCRHLYRAVLSVTCPRRTQRISSTPFQTLFTMSDLKASVVETQNGFHVEGYEKIEYDFTFLDGVFNPSNNNLAKCYERWGRCLAVMDLNIYNVYGDEMQKYFDHYNLPLTIHKTMIGEKAKSMETLLSIVDSMTDFGIIRKEPVLVVVRCSVQWGAAKC
jgi:3-dehydroquinate synthase